MKRLKLSRDTVRVLAADLRRVVGGAREPQYEPTDGCASYTGQQGQCYCDSILTCK